MAITITLTTKTPKKWLTAASKDMDALLHDQAEVARKNSALALYLVSKYPQYNKLVGGLIDIAQVQLKHFGDLYDEMQARKIRLGRELGSDLYISRILAKCRLGRRERYMDRLIVNATALLRGAERYEMLLEKVSDAKLKALYKHIAKENSDLAQKYIGLALLQFKEEDVKARIPEVLAIEAEVMEHAETGPTMH